MGAIKILFNSLCLLIGAGLAFSASGESLRGRFATGQAYSAEYSLSSGKNADGMRTEHVTITASLDGNRVPLRYEYDADDYPPVRKSPLGLLTIVTNSGGMEGAVTYNYVLPFNGALISVGTVQTPLHLGKAQSIDVRKNEDLSSEDVSRIVSRVVDFGGRALVSARDPYISAAFLFFGLRCRGGKDYSFLHTLLVEKEIADDPIFYRRLRSSICLPTDQAGR